MAAVCYSGLPKLGMSFHQLKTDPKVFDLTLRGLKPFEIRFKDRDFKTGDLVNLRETEFPFSEISNGSPLIYTGRTILAEITSVIEGYGLRDNWIALGLEVVISEPLSPKKPDLFHQAGA